MAFNVDFTGKPLFKETKYNKYDPNFTKAYVGTPDWLVRVSKMVNSIGISIPHHLISFSKVGNTAFSASLEKHGIIISTKFV